MARMSKRQQKLTDEEIDELVIAKAFDDLAWDEPVQVCRPVSESYSLPADLAARATFLAHLHRARIEEWLTLVIQERIELEEGAFAEAKRALAKDSRAALKVSLPAKRAT
jgi:hypothetical protein